MKYSMSVLFFSASLLYDRGNTMDLIYDKFVALIYYIA